MKARLVVLLFSGLALFVSCNRDPNVAKRKYLQRGDAYFKREQYKQAALMYRTALQKDARFGMAHYKLALTDLKLGQAAPAVGELRRAVELLPANSAERTDANVKLVEIYLLSNQRDKQLLDEIDGVVGDLLKKDPNSFDGHRLAGASAFNNARAAFASHKPDDGRAFLKTSIDEFRKANAIKPDDRGVQVALADALIVNQQYPDAEKLYLALVNKDKTFAPGYVQLYKLYILQNRISDAENILKQAVAANPKEYSWLTSLAWHYFLTRRKDDMVRVLDQIKSRAAEFPDAYLTVGDFYLRLGDSDEAIRQYKEGIAADSKRKTIYEKREIEVLMRQGNRNMAAEINNAILKADPKDNFARGLEAQLMLDKGEVQKAVTELQSVITGDPRNFVAHFNLGRAHMLRQEYEQARQQFTEAIRLRPDYVPAREQLARLYVMRSDYDSALKAAAEILQFDRNNLAARIIQSAALMGMKKYAESRTLLDAMLKVNPNSTDTLFQLGVVNLAEAKYKDAEDAFRKDYSLEPANARGLMGLIEVYMAQNREDEAIQLLQSEQQKYPNRMDYHVALGNTAVRAGKYDLAIAEFQKFADSLGKDSKSAADIYLRIGETYRRKGDLNGSINALQKARNLAPDSTIILSTLALALDAAGQKVQAKTAYEQCLKLDPRNGVALNNLAYLLAENNGDLDQALTYAQRAKQLLPTLNEVSDTLGWIYLKKQLTDNAVETFKEIVEKQPTHSTYRYHLGMAYAQKGDRLKAIQELNGALKDNPPKDEQDKIKQLLTKLG